jgi:DNA-binding transcriptional LysR family regulator
VAALLPGIITRLSERYPGISVNIEQISLPISVEAKRLRQRTVDMIIARGLAEPPELDLEADVLFHESFIVVAGAQNPLCRRRKVELSELMKERWVLFPEDEIPGALVRQAFRARGLDIPRATAYTMSYHLRDVL